MRTEHELLVDIISAGSKALFNSQVGCILQTFIGKIQVKFSQVLYLFCFVSYAFPNLEKKSQNILEVFQICGGWYFKMILAFKIYKHFVGSVTH